MRLAVIVATGHAGGDAVSATGDAVATVATVSAALSRLGYAAVVVNAAGSVDEVERELRLALVTTEEPLAAPADRVDELFERARTLVAEEGNVHAAIAPLEMARAIDPDRDDVLEALRRAYRALARWPELIEVTGALADRAKTTAERAARRAVQARIALDHLHDEPLGLTFLEAALEQDPTHDEALDLLLELRARRREQGALAQTLAHLIARLEEIGDDERARDVTRRLDALGADGADRTDELLAQGDEDRALEELEDAVLRTPLHVHTHARLFAIHMRQRRFDRAYLAALALEELDALEDAHRVILERERPPGLRIRAQLDEAAWQILRAPGSDDVAEALFGAVARAAIATRVEERRARRTLVPLDPELRQPAESTASIVRTFGWASRALGVACPSLYVLDDVPGDIAAAPAAEPSTMLGPDLVSGLSTKELAFVAARHLTYQRREYSVLVHFPTVPELTLLVLAAVQLAIPAMPIPPAVAEPVAALRLGLSRHLSDGEREAMTAAVERLDARNGRIDLASWSRAVELTATRAGLLLCGDLKTAMDRIRHESRGAPDVRARSHVPADERRADLLAFCGARALADLRLKFAVVASTPPPAVDDRATSSEWRSTRSSHRDELDVEKAG